MNNVELQTVLFLEGVKMVRCKAIASAVILGLFVWSFMPSAAHGAAAVPAPVTPPTEPRASLVVNRMDLEGEVAGDLAHMRMTLEAEAYRDGEQSLWLLPGNLSITTWSVKSTSYFGPGAYLRRTGDAVELVVDGKGKYALDLQFIVTVAKARMGNKVTLPVVPALVARTQLTVPGADLEFKADRGASLETLEKRDKTTVVIYGGEGPVALSWSPKTPEKALKPVIFADQTLHARIGQGVLRLESSINYSIIQGAVKEFEVRFPADCSLLGVEGKDIRTWDVAEAKEGEPHLLKVALLGEVEKEYQLSLRLEKVLSSVKMEGLDLPVIEPLNVAREKGTVAVYSAKGISVEAVVVKDISHVDVLEMAPGRDATEEARLGFRYLKRPFTLTLRTGEVVAKTSAEVFSLVRAGMDSMRMTSNLVYTIRDAGIFQLRVKLDDGLKLIDIVGQNINNWDLDPAGHTLTVTLRSKAEGSYSLQIETELEKPAPEKAPVPFVHALDVDRESGYIAVLPAPGIKVETAALGGIAQIDVRELPDELLKQAPALAYRYIRADCSAAVRISEIAPEVQTEVQTVAVLDEHELTMRTVINYTIRRAGIFQMRVSIPKDLRRRNIEGADIDDHSWDEEKGILTVNLKTKVADRYVLTIDTAKTIPQLEPGLDLPVIKTEGVDKERGFLAVSTKASVRLKTAEGENKKAGLEDISISDLPPEMLQRAGSVALAYKYFSQPWNLALAVERIEPRVTAEVFNLLSIGEKLMTVSATIRYSILHAGVDTFVVQVPPGATAVDIDGDGIKHREENKADHTWTITLQSKRADAYTLYVNFQENLTQDQVEIPYSGVTAMNIEPGPGKTTDGAGAYKVERETGYLAITSRADVELKVPDQDIQNLTAIDAREIPSNYMEGVALPVLLAFRYVSHPYTIRMGAQPHEAADVTLAVIESAKLSTTVTEEGNMITDLVFMLRNSRQEYVSLQLPEGSRIWHAFVGGESVTPLQDRDSKITRLPVARVAGGQNAFEVRLRYSGKQAELGRAGSIRLDSPLKDIDIMRLGWTVSLPEGYDIVRDSGSIRKLDYSTQMEGVLQSLNTDVQVESRNPPAGQGVNLPARDKGDVQLYYNAVAQQAVAAEFSQKGRANVSMYTGQKPSQERVFLFQSLIVSGKQPSFVQAQYLKRSIGLPLEGILVLGVVLCGAGVWRARRYRFGARLAVLAAAAIVVLGIRTLAEGTYRGPLTVIFATLLALLVAMAAWVIIGWFRNVRCSGKTASVKPPEPPQPEAGKKADKG
jgi:hypothetical protein